MEVKLNKQFKNQNLILNMLYISIHTTLYKYIDKNMVT